MKIMILNILIRSLFSIMDAEMPDNAKKLYAGQIRGEHDLLYFDVSVCGSKFKALLDCGASREFIDLKAAQDRGFCMKDLKESFFIKLADGNEIECRQYIEVKLKLKGFDHNCILYVIDLKGEHEIILGRSFLVSRNPDIDWVTGEMNLRKKTQ